MSEHCGCRVDQYGNYIYEACRYPAALEAIRRLRKFIITDVCEAVDDDRTVAILKETEQWVK